jgi:hypothetical protein
MGVGLVSSLLDVRLAGQAVEPVGSYQLSDGMQNCLSHLFAVAGQFSIPLTCDSSGYLNVTFSGLATIVSDFADDVAAFDAAVDLFVAAVPDFHFATTHELKVEIGAYGYVATTCGIAGVGPTSIGLVVGNPYLVDAADLLADLYALLSDVYDATNHCLAVKVITP